MRRRTPRSLVALCGILLCGCATIISGSNQAIEVNSDPVGAKVTVQPGNVTVTTPAHLTLKRNENGYRLRFEKADFQAVDVRLTSTTNGWVYGNLLIGGIIGLLIDYGNGAAYALSPAEVTATLHPIEATAPLRDGAQLVVVDRHGMLLATIALE